MTINHIDQLAQWWDEAEEGVIEKGDTVINRSDGETTVYVATERARRHHTNARILARAPIPKPAWHDALAVNAYTDYCERQVWERDPSGWHGTAGDFATTEELRGVTPLIEAKVTNDMVLRALNASTGLDLSCLTSFKRNEVEDMHFALSAALGIETE